MVFCNEPLERVKLHVLSMNFMMGSVQAVLQDKSQQKRLCKQVITNPTSSRMPMIIARVVMYVKFMDKGLP